MEQDKIINRIRKVLALTKSTYQEEAHAALLKAQELMAQHGFTMTEIEISQENHEKEVVDMCVSKKKRNAWYEKSLAATVGGNFRCHPYFTPGSGVYFIGIKEDVNIAIKVYLYALKTMVFLANDYVKKNSLGMSSKGIKNDYLFGFLRGLKEKFEAQVESKGYALILIKDALVDQAVDQKRLRKRKANPVIIAGASDAREAGYQDGRAFDGNRKMIQ